MLRSDNYSTRKIIPSTILSVLRNYSYGQIIYSLVYYLLAIILLFTGTTKIIDPLPLINTLKLIPLLEGNLVVPIATLLPVFEIGLGLLMLLKIETKITLTAVAVLFFAFLGFSIYGTVVGLDADCGCFGNAIKSEFGWGMVLRNLLLFIFSGYISFDNSLQGKI